MTVPVGGAENMTPSPACDVVMAADHPPHGAGGPCADFAFRRGTEANGCPETVELARLCVEGFREFHCHLHPHVCRGFMAALNLRGVPTTEDDEKWCEVARAAADILSDCIHRASAEDLAERDAVVKAR